MEITLNFNWFFILLNKIKVISYYIILLLITSIIVLVITKKINFNSILIIILFYTLILIIFSTFGNNILSISVSPTINPVPPNTGLDGISKLNIIAGQY